MERHVDVIARDGMRLATYPITLGTDDAKRREAEYFEEARRRARDENLVAHEAEAQALRFQFATGPR
jgi:hypothetical protein